MCRMEEGALAKHQPPPKPNLHFNAFLIPPQGYVLSGFSPKAGGCCFSAGLTCCHSPPQP